MFTKITLRNYRTHKQTTLNLKPITLLIGNNNSGKSNFLAGLDHFSRLISRGRPERPDSEKTVRQADYYPHRYRLAEDNEGIGVCIAWTKEASKINYQMDLYLDQSGPQKVRCKEKISLSSHIKESERTLTSGYDKPTDRIALRSMIEETSSFDASEKWLCRRFFRDFANVFTYHLQPSFLKDLVRETRAINDNFGAQGEIRIPRDLGYEGRNFQQLLFYAKNKEERVFSRFVALVRRFNEMFHGIRLNTKSEPIWEFDLGRKTPDRLIDEFPPNVLSDGFIKAAAIALLMSLRSPPALIFLEEIENGINPGNIQEIMTWIWQATSPTQADDAPQFILTSHSPAVLREFHEHLDHVYTFHLDKRNFRSDARNLNTVLETLVGIGTVEGETIEDQAGNPIIKIPRYQLAELWYSGTIG